MKQGKEKRSEAGGVQPCQFKEKVVVRGETKSVVPSKGRCWPLDRITYPRVKSGMIVATGHDSCGVAPLRHLRGGLGQLGERQKHLSLPKQGLLVNERREKDRGETKTEKQPS